MRIALLVIAATATATADPAPPVAIDNGKPGAFTITALAAGDYRLVVKTCDGATTVPGPAFHFDGHTR